MKRLSPLIIFFMLAACESYETASLSDADVYHWENRFVTMQTFIEDHKKCLGVKTVAVESKLSRLLDPASPRVVPRWDGLWATFSSRESGEMTQRIAVSSTGKQATASSEVYEECMLQAGYNAVNYNY